MNASYADLLNEITRFVNETDDISCLALIGSQGGDGTLADDYSDIDLLIVTGNLRFYLDTDSWLQKIRECWVSFAESAPEIGYWERRAVFDGGLDADFVLVDEGLLAFPDKLPVVREICDINKLSILIDKKGISDRVLALGSEPRAIGLPTEAAFANLVGDFYFHCLWAKKKLMRGEYWVAYRCVNGYLKARLLSMIEWYSRSIHGDAHPIGYDGRFLEQWADPEIIDELKACFCGMEKEPIATALNATGDLFSRLARIVADKNVFRYPTLGADRIRSLVRD